MSRARGTRLSCLLIASLVLLVLAGCTSSSRDEGDAASRFSRVTLRVVPIDQLGNNSMRRGASAAQTRQIRPAPAILQIDVAAGDISPIKASCQIPEPPTPGATATCDAVGTPEATLTVTDTTDTAVTVTSTLLVPTGTQRRVVVTILDASGLITFQGQNTVDLPDTQAALSLVLGLNGSPMPIAPPILTVKNTVGNSQTDANDFEAGQTHDFVMTTPPANGTATINTSGVVTYNPNADFVGDDSLTVTVADNGIPALAGAVTINITVLPDADGDRLADLDEAVQGTDPNNPDTDSDGLLDGDEVNVYSTNPLHPDSDSDGFSDGIEIIEEGTDPLDSNSTPPIRSFILDQSPLDDLRFILPQL